MIIKVTDPCQPLACPSLYDETRPLEVEGGCGRGRFLTGRAARHPECEFLGVERMKERVNVFDGKTRRLKLTNAHVVRLEARPPNIEGKGAVTIRDLVKNCLRMRPDRIIVGECRGGEALDMLQAISLEHRQ